MAPTISSDKLAKLICRDIRTVHRLAVQGILPRARHPDGTPMRGQFELIGSIQGFIRYLDTQLGLAALNDTDFRIERTKLIRCQRERLELETAVFRNELHRSDDVEAIMNDVLSGIKMRFLAIPTRHARSLMAQTQLARFIDMLSDAIETALGDVMSYSAQQFLERNPEYLRAKGIELDALLRERAEAEPSDGNGEASLSQETVLDSYQSASQP